MFTDKSDGVVLLWRTGWPGAVKRVGCADGGFAVTETEGTVYGGLRLSPDSSAERLGARKKEESGTSDSQQMLAWGNPNIC